MLIDENKDYKDQMTRLFDDNNSIYLDEID